MNDFYSLDTAGQEQILQQLAQSALINWQLTGELRLIKFRENAVYELVADNGERYALRIHRPGYHSAQALTAECLWLNALVQQGIAVPSIIPTLNGDYFVAAKIDEVPETRFVDLIEWVDGKQIGSVESGLPQDSEQLKDIYQTVGRVAAQLHNQASNWDIPEGFERHHWDENGLVGSDPFWGKFWQLAALNPKQRELLQNARDKVYQGLLDYGKTTANFSLIHADLVPENLLVDKDTVQVIDFDDAGFGWHLFDIATALYFIQDDSNYDIAKDALIAGYRECRTLPNADLDALPLFLAARSFTYLGWVHQRPNEEAAQELTPMLIELCCSTCQNYLSR